MATSPIDVSGLLQGFGLGGASNLDVNTIVSEILSVDAQPLTTMQTTVNSDQTTISTYAAILSNLSSLQSSVNAMQNTTAGLSATSSNTSAFTATGASGAVAGNTAIDVNTVASAQSLYSTAFGSQTSAVADLSETPTQYLKIQSGSNTQTITINSSNNTLTGIMNAINKANAGVTATVVQQASDFVIGSGNDTINFSYGGDTYTATIAQGDYSGSGLASAITSAMNSAKDGSDVTITGSPFSANYNASNEFSITNNSATNTAQINWASSTLTPQQLGFMPDAGTDNYGASPGSESSTIGTGTVDGPTITGTSVNGMYALSLTSNSTGASNGITVKVDESASNFGAGYIGETGSNIDQIGLSALASDATFDSSNNRLTGYSNLTQTSAAVDASLTVGGVPVTSASNTLTSAIPGVTLNLLAQGNGTLSVALDSSALASQMNSLVTAYNSSISTINIYYQPILQGQQATETNQGLLSGDSGLMGLTNAMNGFTMTPYGTDTDLANNYLASIGLTHNKDGTLAFNASTLSSAYQSDSANITGMINSMAKSFGSTLDNFVNTVIPGEQSNYQTQITSLQSQETAFESQLNLEQTNLINQYSTLENVVTSDNAISNYLTQQDLYNTKNTNGG